MVAEEIIHGMEGKIQFLEAELATYRQRCEQYSQAYDSLKSQLQELLRYRFGKKSERFVEDPNDPQLNLFSDDLLPSPTLEDTSAPITNEVITVESHTRQKKSNKEKLLPRRIEIIPVSEEEKQCSCGACKTVIRYETKELIHYQPALVEILEQRREVVACPKGCEQQIITAPAPLHVLPKAKVTEEFLSFLVTSKLEDRQPLYHLEKQLASRYGADCKRQTMARWVIDLMAPLQPIYNLLHDILVDYDVASCDATTLQVLKEPGRAAETKSYVYCACGGAPEQSVVLYRYNDKLHQQFVFDWLEGFTGYLHVDGDNFFDTIGRVATRVYCNAHARRKFEAVSKQAKHKGLAVEALRFYKALYKIERDAKNQELTPTQRHAFRLEHSKPLLETFKQWLDTHQPTVLPQSPLGNAFNYCIKRWDGLIRFLDDGRLEIDNNLTEQKIRPIAIGRKNFLFADSVDGAKAFSLHMSLIQTAKLHKREPYQYYTTLLKRLPHCQSLEDFEQLLPWNIFK